MSSNENPPATTVTPVDSLKPHPVYFFEDLYIAIEDDLFKVPRREFENNSEVFHDMYTVPVPEGKPADGSSQEHPLYLPGVTSDEFVQMLKILFSDRYGKSAVLDRAQCESVLRLANLWQFKAIRAVAIARLEETVGKMSPQEALLMARKYDVGHWLIDAVEVMAKRAEPISVQDVRIIGLEDALRVAHVREQSANILRVSSRGPGWLDWKERSALNFRPTIKTVFGIGDVVARESPAVTK